MNRKVHGRFHLFLQIPFAPSKLARNDVAKQQTRTFLPFSTRMRGSKASPQQAAPWGGYSFWRPTPSPPPHCRGCSHCRGCRSPIGQPLRFGKMWSGRNLSNEHEILVRGKGNRKSELRGAAEITGIYFQDPGGSFLKGRF